MDYKALLASAIIGSTTLLPAHSFAADKLTAASIDSFYQQTAQTQTQPVSIQLNHLRKHLSKSGKFTINSTTDLSAFGAPAGSESMSLNYNQILKETRKNADTMDVTHYTSQTQNIKISADGKSATLTEHAKGAAVGDHPTPNGPLGIKISISATCNDKLSLNNNTIIVDNSICNVSSTITPVTGAF